MNCLCIGSVEISKIYISTTNKLPTENELTLYITCYNCQDNPNLIQKYFYSLKDYTIFLIKNNNSQNQSNIKDIYNFTKYETTYKNELIDSIPFKSLNAFYDTYRVPLISYETNLIEYFESYYLHNEHKEELEQKLLHYIDLNKQLYSLLEIILKLYFKSKHKSIYPFLLIKSLHYLCSILTPLFPVFNKSIISSLEHINIMNLPYLMQTKSQYKKLRNNLNLVTFKTHPLPVVSLCQLKSGLILSGSYKLINVYKYCPTIKEYKLDYTNEHVVNGLPSHIEEINESGIVVITSCLHLTEYNPMTKKVVYIYYNLHRNQIQYVISIKQGSYLISCSNDQTTKIINRTTHEVEQTIESNINRYYNGILYYEINNYTKLLFTIDNQIEVYKDTYPSPCFTRLQVLDHHKTIITLLIQINSNRFAAGSYGEKINLILFKYDVSTQLFEKDVVLYGHTDAVYSLTYIKSHEYLLSGSREGSVRVWDLVTNQCLTVFKFKIDHVYMLIQLHDGRIMCSCANHLVHIFNCIHLKNKINYCRNTGIEGKKVKYNFNY
jgi:WD40 repeat protein